MHDAISSHLRGIEGCAAHLAVPPPILDGLQGADADADAWRCYGQILFWLHLPGVSVDEQHARCTPLWERLITCLLDAAVDPLQQFRYAAVFAQDIRTSALGRIIDAFPAQACTVLHHGLSAPDRLPIHTTISK